MSQLIFKRIVLKRVKDYFDGVGIQKIIQKEVGGVWMDTSVWYKLCEEHKEVITGKFIYKDVEVIDD